MTSDIAQFIRVAKRLNQATGYLELGMAQHTLDCLRDLGPLGPFEGEAELLRGEALRRQHRYRDAAVALRTAAEKFPAPQDKVAWLVLSRCYRLAGAHAKAVQMLAHARGAFPSRNG